ncbi:MAG: M20 family metallopeptidase [Candidatus Omnitrophota bacterium]|nr:M20 family metallopeptidase [Candidatus Omnitrophota bacterium]
MINKNRLIRLAQDLIRIDSQNPPGDEWRIARFTRKYLAKSGVKSRIYAFKKRRANLVARIPGKSRGRSLLITPHLDTVPCGASWKFKPFAARIKNGKIYGLGATDCKANLACALEVINSIREEAVALNYDLIFCATADEESGSGLGLAPLLDKKILQPEAAVVLDADDFDIIIAQKGLVHVKVKIQGRRAHGAYPWRGINAIDLAVRIIREIKEKNFAFRKNRYLRAPTVNVGTIRGGDKVNVVADWCEFELDFRFLPGTRAEELLGQLKKTVRRHAREFKIEVEGIQKPYRMSEYHPLVSGLKKAMRRVRVSPRIKGSEGATVISFFQDKHIPAVATGFGSGGCAHAADEYVKISSLYKGAQVLEEFLKDYTKG